MSTLTTSPMKNKDILLIIALIVLMIIIGIKAHSQDLQDVYSRINAIRRENKLPEFEVSKSLEKKAHRYLQFMIKKYNGRLVHSHVEGEWELLVYNIDPVIGWMASPPHRTILLNAKVKKIGISILNKYACLKGLSN